MIDLMWFLPKLGFLSFRKPCLASHSRNIKWLPPLLCLCNASRYATVASVPTVISMQHLYTRRGTKSEEEKNIGLAK